LWALLVIPTAAAAFIGIALTRTRSPWSTTTTVAIFYNPKPETFYGTAWTSAESTIAVDAPAQ
jgi:hypothetical protein